jgi:hypothetical protein
VDLLRIVSIVSLAFGFAGALAVAIDILTGYRQQMAIMNWVWPITVLWAGPFGLWAYFAFGRAGKPESKKDKPFWQVIAVGDLHCASGCTLGDFAGEWLVFLTGLTIAGSTLWADYIFDFALAYAAGIIFQYFAIAPMRHLSGWPGLVAAIKADSISLAAFEVGMFAWMALTHEVLFKPPLKPAQWEYWFMMQIAMAVGFATAYPANWWLIRKGIKETM